MFDAVIFGSGLAGLSCARRLALLGKKVCVVEKSPVLGGHLHPFTRRGITFEVGIHYIASCGADSLFARACADLQINPEVIPLDAEFEEIRGEKSGALWCIRSPFSQYIADLRNRFPTHAAAFATLADDANALWEFANKLSFPLRTLTLIKHVLLSPKRFRLARLATMTLDRYLARVLGLSSAAVEVVALQHLLVGVPPSRVSALVALLVHRYYFEGACFVRGGGRSLVEMLKHPAVEYVVGASARFERRENGEGFRVAWEGGALETRAVVWTPDPRLLSQATSIDPGWLLRWRLKRVSEPHALVVGFFATRKELPAYGFSNRNYWLTGDLSSERAYEELPLATLATQGPIYLSTGSLRDPLAVPAENAMGAKGLFQAMFLVPPHHPEWSGEGYRGKKKEILDILIARVISSFPELRDDLVWMELGTPLTHTRYLYSLSCNGYGFSATVFDVLLGRPSVKTSVPGLYLCGAHVKPAHGIATTLVNGVGLGTMLGTRK